MVLTALLNHIVRREPLLLHMVSLLWCSASGGALQQQSARIEAGLLVPQLFQVLDEAPSLLRWP